MKNGIYRRCPSGLLSLKMFLSMSKVSKSAEWYSITVIMEKEKNNRLTLHAHFEELAK